MSGYEEKMGNMGITLPRTPTPATAYILAKKVGTLVFCSGQGPSVEGKIVHIGKVELLFPLSGG